MKVSFLVPDIHSPVLGPVTELARHLQPEYAVEIVGPDMGHGVCPMYKNAFPYTVVAAPRLYRYPNFFRETGRLLKAVTGDVVVAVKAYADTVAAAWWLKRQRGIKAVAYLDEWDGALSRQLTPSQRLRRWLRHAHHPLDEVYAPLVECLLPRMDMVLSTTTFLQRKFGGEILHVGVDTDYFCSQPPERVEELRRQFNLEGLHLIVFGGVVRPHKGIELILDALVRLARSDVRLAIVGPRNEHVEALRRDPRYRPYLVLLGSQPKDRMPLFLDLATMIVLPLNDSLLARSQMPCKVFEAMAMAKPVIATAVSDLSNIMNGCGWVFPPGDVSQLAAHIQQVIMDPEASARLGALARAKCREFYSKEVTRRRLLTLMSLLDER